MIKLRLILLILSLFYWTNSFSQILGGFDNSDPTPEEIKPSSINSGLIEGSVTSLKEHCKHLIL